MLTKLAVGRDQKILRVRKWPRRSFELLQLTFGTGVGAMPTYLANLEWECASMSHDSFGTGMCARNALWLI